MVVSYSIAYNHTFHYQPATLGNENWITHFWAVRGEKLWNQCRLETVCEWRSELLSYQKLTRLSYEMLRQHRQYKFSRAPTIFPTTARAQKSRVAPTLWMPLCGCMEVEQSYSSQQKKWKKRHPEIFLTRELSSVFNGQMSLGRVNSDEQFEFSMTSSDEFRSHSWTRKALQSSLEAVASRAYIAFCNVKWLRSRKTVDSNVEVSEWDCGLYNNISEEFQGETRRVFFFI